MFGATVVTTAGEQFTMAEHAILCYYIFKRWGRDIPSAAEAYRRLMQNSCHDLEFVTLASAGQDLVEKS